MDGKIEPPSVDAKSGMESVLMKPKNLCKCGNLKYKYSKTCRQCFVPHNKVEVDEQVLVSEYLSGMTVRKISDKYKVDTRRISKILKQNGIEVKKKNSGVFTTSFGYVEVYVSKNDSMGSMRNSHSRVPEHRLIMAYHLGRPLNDKETVHHINGVKDDNRIENLQLRHGNHGPGQVLECGNCGSDNILSVEIATQDKSNKMILAREPALDFSDVLIIPQRSSLTSRKEVDLTREFFFSNSISARVIPIASSNMISVTTEAVAKIMAEHNMLACLPRTLAISNIHENYIQSIGLQDKPNPDFKWICLDVPHAHMDVVLKRVEEVKKMCPDSLLIVGNVVTKEGTKDLINAGASIIKLGIGSGSACRTRIASGVGIPQFSTILECTEEAAKWGAYTMSDGGCQVPGDLAKAFGAGADFVMLGGMLAGHGPDNGTDFYGMSSERANNEFAGGLKDYRTSEGWEMILPDKGPIEATLQDIMGGLRSCCSYVGVKRIQDLPGKATFIRVNNQVNKSLWEFRI